MTTIDTRSVSDRRKLRFSTLDELRRDLDLLEAAERRGTLRRTGNWTLAQALGHLATWADFAYEGFPIRPPWFVRLILKTKRRKYLEQGMPVGVRIPGVEGGTLGAEPLSLDEGLTRLRATIDRLEREDPVHPSPLFGPMSRAECAQATLRHAELHLSFFHPGPQA